MQQVSFFFCGLVEFVILASVQVSELQPGFFSAYPEHIGHPFPYVLYSSLKRIKTIANLNDE